MNKILTGLGIFVGFVLLCFMIAFFGQQSYNSRASTFENRLNEQYQTCNVIRANSINTIISLSDVDGNTKAYLTDLLKNAGTGSTQIQSGFDSAIQTGNPSALLMALSAVSGTNFTITAENLQHQIVSYNAEITLCGSTLNGLKSEYRTHLGLSSDGMVHSWPKSYYFENSTFPTALAMVGLKDNDMDGKLTTLDLMASGSIGIEGQQNGEADAPIRIP